MQELKSKEFLFQGVVKRAVVVQSDGDEAYELLASPDNTPFRFFYKMRRYPYPKEQRELWVGAISEVLGPYRTHLDGVLSALGDLHDKCRQMEDARNEHADTIASFCRGELPLWVEDASDDIFNAMHALWDCVSDLSDAVDCARTALGEAPPEPALRTLPALLAAAQEALSAQAEPPTEEEWNVRLPLDAHVLRLKHGAALLAQMVELFAQYVAPTMQAVKACTVEVEDILLNHDYGYDSRPFDHVDLLKQALDDDQPFNIVGQGGLRVWPLYKYEHSGIAMSLGRGYPFNCSFDSAHIGWVITSDELLKAFHGGECPWTDEQIRTCAGEFATRLGQYINGDVEEGYVTEDDGYDADNFNTGVTFGYVDLDDVAAEYVKFKLRADAAGSEYKYVAPGTKVVGAYKGGEGLVALLLVDGRTVILDPDQEDQVYENWDVMHSELGVYMDESAELAEAWKNGYGSWSWC